MAQKVYDAKFEQWLDKFMNENLPEKIYDAHFHISRSYAERCGYGDRVFEQYAEFMDKHAPGRLTGGLMMVQPGPRDEALAEDNDYILSLAEEHGFDVGVVLQPSNTREETEAILNAHPCIKALKPYFCYADVENQYEANISDYAPDWMWSLAHDRKMPILVHLSHYQDLLWDEANIREIRYFCEKYPDAKLILAHCAMGHNVPKLKLGLEGIKDLKNIWIDNSGSCETMAIYYCLKAFGVEKMMFGGDYNFGEAVGRICSFGTNFIGLHKGYVNMDVVDRSPYDYQPLNNMQEGLICFFQAAELLDLSKQDIEDIFYNNAKKLFK